MVEKGHLYYWNSRLGYRSKLFSPFYHVHDEIDNPRTNSGFFPDSLGFSRSWAEGWGVPRVENLWSKGGHLKHGLKMVIGCNKPKESYRAGELLGLRCAIIHARFDSDTYLAKAYYSPNKIGRPPEVTFYIDAPEDAANEKAGLAYLGDDIIYGDRPAYDLIRIPPGKAFNPSPDQHYYNKWAGIYRFETPGVYRFWCSYTFDSLSSNIEISGIDTLYSDTLEVIIE